MEVQLYLNLNRTGMFMNGSLNVDASVHYEGLHYFDSMSSVHWISARVEHCACLVHPFGRAGHLDEVKDVVKRMPCEPDTSAWSTVLAACRVHCNVRWENLLQTEFLKSTLEMLWAMCCYQTSVLLLASGTISSQTFNDRGWNTVWAKQPVVAPGLR
jgi:hypothetical protein